MDCSRAAKAASTPLTGWSLANPAGLKSTSVTARKRSSALLKHINGDYSLVEVNYIAITADSGFLCSCYKFNLWVNLCPKNSFYSKPLPIFFLLRVNLCP